MPLVGEVPPISEYTLRFFRRIVRRYFRKHFRAVLVQHAERLREHKGPLIVFGNHSSWWDPMVIMLMGDLVMPHRKHYAPMDATALNKYPILKKLGVFPVEMASARGAAQFLRTAEAVLRDNGVLWITPQGRFADTREFPLAFKPGLAALTLRMPEVPLMPIALEYTFWDERLPETLLHFGEPVRVDPAMPAAEVTQQLEGVLGGAMYSLQQASVKRDSRLFTSVLSGERGTGGTYGLFRRAKALLEGRRPELDHTQRSDG